MRTKWEDLLKETDFPPPSLGIALRCPSFSGNDIGPFKAIEESTLAQLVVVQDRATVFAWYNLVGGAASACGSLSAGWLTSWMAMKSDRNDTANPPRQHIKGYVSVGRISGDRVIFVLYATWAMIKLLLNLQLTQACEVQRWRPRWRRPKNYWLRMAGPR